MTIRSTIGTAEVTLEGTESRTVMSASRLVRYEVEDLLEALAEVLRGVGDGRLTADAERILTLLEGEDPEEQPATGDSEEDDRPTLLAGGTPLSWQGTSYRVKFVDVMSAREGQDEPEGRIRLVVTLDEIEEPWTPPVAGATGSPLL